MADRRLPLWIVALTTVVALAASVATYQALDDGTAAGTNDGDPEPSGDVADIDLSELTYQDLSGTTHALADRRGEPLVINFFASWCTPCRAEIPAFERVHQDVDGVAFLGLAVQDRPEDTRGFVEELGVTYDVGRDVDSAVGVETGAIVKLPGTVVVDAEGHVVARHIGALDEGELRELLRDELGIDA